MKPRILLLDEPLSALDGVIKESIKERIKTIAREYHLTTIIVTHDPEEALTLSDRVLIIDGGRIAQYGQPSEIIHRPNNDFGRALGNSFRVSAAAAVPADHHLRLCHHLFLRQTGPADTGVRPSAVQYLWLRRDV